MKSPHNCSNVKKTYELKAHDLAVSLIALMLHCYEATEILESPWTTLHVCNAARVVALIPTHLGMPTDLAGVPYHDIAVGGHC